VAGKSAGAGLSGAIDRLGKLFGDDTGTRGSDLVHNAEASEEVKRLPTKSSM
jgi:hypothetical protein